MKMTLQDKVYNYPTKYQEGFIGEELKALIRTFPIMNMEKFYKAMEGDTCMVINGEVVSYHCDVLKALRCGIGNRNLALSEWD
jgi:hypothetical protein